MSILKSLLERKLPPFDQLPLEDSPPAIKEKVCFIAKLIDQARLLVKTKQTFSTKIPNFDLHFNMIQELEEEFIEDLTIIRGVVSENKFFTSALQKAWEGIKSEKSSKNPQVRVNYIKLMGNAKYKPGQEISDLVAMLEELFYYWLAWPLSLLEIAVGGDPPKAIGTELSGLLASTSNIEAVLDLSLAKIAYHVGIKTALIRQRGRREGTRTVRSTEGKQKVKRGYAEYVFEAFWKLKGDFPKEASLNKVAVMIREALICPATPAPSCIDTIKSYLREDQKIWEQFRVTQNKGKNSIIMKM